MFLDLKSHGEPWEDGRLRRSCQLPIGPSDPVEELQFVGDYDHRLEELNGIYHAHCASPFVGMKRALDLLSRFPYG